MKRLIIAYLTFFTIFLLTVVFSRATTCSFSWIPNSESILKGYKLHYGKVSGQYTEHFDAGLPDTVDGRVHTSLPICVDGIWYLAATAYGDNVESDFSKELILQFPKVSYACFLGDKFKEIILNNGVEYYTDRTYVLTNVPVKYIGMDAVILPNDDRKLKDEENYLTFNPDFHAQIYVAYDSRAVSLPEWLDGFVDTGDVIETSLTSQPFLKVYRRWYSSTDCVRFGANQSPGFSGDIVSNYIIFYGTSIPVIRSVKRRES